MADSTRRPWLTAAAFATLVGAYFVGGTSLVALAFARVGCDGCDASATDAALSAFFWVGAGIFLVTAIVVAALVGRRPIWGIAVSAFIALAVLYTACIATLALSSGA